jgi:hypothetical protein
LKQIKGNANPLQPIVDSLKRDNATLRKRVAELEDALIERNNAQFVERLA